MKEYALKEVNGGYICKGSYRLNGKKYKILGSSDDAMTYKTLESAQNALKRIQEKEFENIRVTEIICFTIYERAKDEK